MIVSDQLLRNLHIGAASAHFVQFMYAEALVNTSFSKKGYFPVDNRLGTRENVISEYQLTQVVPIFSLLSTCNHVWSAIRFDAYRDQIEQGYNPWRWIEFSASASLMNYIVGQLSGITDIKLLSALIGANVSLQYIGYSLEKDSGRALQMHDSHLYESAMRQQVAGFLIFATYMSAIFTSFFTAISQTAGVPDFVYSVIFIIFALYLCFGVLSLAYTRGAKPGPQPKWSIRNFRNVEVGYLVLSFVAKTFLLNMVLFGASRDKVEENP